MDRGISWPKPEYTPGFSLDGVILWPVTPNTGIEKMPPGLQFLVGSVLYRLT